MTQQTKIPLKPTQECDLVMKGGITSGIVYPKVATKLALDYRFKCIGGTSAGAIAAAVTAAAEYRRQHDGKPDGFTDLDELADALSQGTLLRDLFQPSSGTRPIMEIASAAFKGARSRSKFSRVLEKLGRVHWAALRYAPAPCLTGAAAGAGVWAAFVTLAGGKMDRDAAILPLVASIYGGAGLGVVAALAHSLLSTLPTSNYFGICTGYEKDPPKPVLTDWLHQQIQKIAGKGSGDMPLTFGELEDAEITLRMFTSNLSQGQPYRLPFDASQQFIVKRQEMEDLFPPSVVNLLCASGSAAGRKLPGGYFSLPVGKALPVVFATRLSLSFPVLISAIPLYTIGLSAVSENGDLRETDLQRNLFSDGGICSNFPIQLFDDWIPSRPTFGIELTSWPAEAIDGAGKLKPGHFAAASDAPSPGTAAPVEPVYLPIPAEMVPPEWHSITALPAFVGAIFSTAQDYRDTMQAELPGYRERIVQIRLKNDQGGLNLDMPENIRKQIEKLGSDAAALLVSRYVQGPGMAEHQWVRFLCLMDQLEQQLRDLDPADSAGMVAIIDHLQAQLPDYPYAHDAQWQGQVSSLIRDLCNFATTSKSKAALFTRDPPLPQGVLRITPDV